MFFSHLEYKPPGLSSPAVHPLRTSGGELLSTLPVGAKTCEGVEAGWPFVVTELQLSPVCCLILDTRKLGRSRLLRTTALVQRRQDGAWVHVNGLDFYRSLVSYRVSSHALRWVQEQHADQLCKLDGLRSEIARHYGEKPWLDSTGPTDQTQEAERQAQACES